MKQRLFLNEYAISSSALISVKQILLSLSLLHVHSADQTVQAIHRQSVLTEKSDRIAFVEVACLVGQRSDHFA